ncbi:MULTISPECIES: winged helix-turn-helix domain-containing protein [unclassified Microcoleus]|uniref:winged helix-turn-helix domain-containing protein n=1 Tax=unclassified Microcoleus TaxID=2642155 RepID=UPI002FD73E53
MVVKNRASTAASRISESFGERQIYDNQVVTKVATCGLSELLLVKKAPGQEPHLTGDVLEGLKERLATGVPFKSYGEIVEWLKSEYNLFLTYATVYAWVHYRHIAKLKVPRPQSALQDVEAVELFKKTSFQQY